MSKITQLAGGQLTRADHLAVEPGVILCTLGFTRQVIDALDAIAKAAPNAPKQLLDPAMDAFLRQCADPRPWWQQSSWGDERRRLEAGSGGPPIRTRLGGPSISWAANCHLPPDWAG